MSSDDECISIPDGGCGEDLPVRANREDDDGGDNDDEVCNNYDNNYNYTDNNRGAE